jgi:hypothetical protein
VRKLAKLLIFFGITFIIIFVTAICLRFLFLRVEWAKNLPPKPETILTLIITAAHWALSLALFSSILLTISYIVKKGFSPLISIACVILLSFSFCLIVSFILHHWRSVPPAQTAGIQLGDKGLILSNSVNRNLTSVVLLEGMANPYGPRVMAIPGQPLVFHEALPAERDLSLPPVPFGDETPWFLKSLDIDIRLNGEIFRQKFAEGFLWFFIYTFSLIFLLCSLGYAIKFSAWPLANLFLTMLAFRFILAIGSFFNSPEMQGLIDTFLNNIIPVNFALPLFFLAFGLLINSYSILAFAAKRQDNYD